MPKTALRARAFSLTDITVTILVIAILMAILLPAVSRAYKAAQRNRIAADMQVISTALEAFRQDNGNYPFVKPNDGNTMRGAATLAAALLNTKNPYLSLDRTRTENGVLLDMNGNPVLYYPALPSRRDLTVADSYVGTLAPDDTAGRRPMFNAFDNSAAMNENVLRNLLGAESNGAVRVSTTSDSRQQMGAYVLISAGVDGLFGTEDDIVLGGGRSVRGTTPFGALTGDLYAHADINQQGAPPVDDHLSLHQRQQNNNGSGSGNNPNSSSPPPLPPMASNRPDRPERQPTEVPADAINIADFGAVGDGKTDDTKAIQDAIAAANGGPIVFPEGTYNISTTLNLTNGGSYYGPGIINMTGSGKFAAEINNKQNVTIDGLTFIGKGIKLEGDTSGTTIVNTRFENISGGGVFNDAIFAPTGVRNSVIMYNEFINVAGNGVMAYGFSTDSLINNNYFENVWEGIHIWTDGGKNLEMSNNVGVGFKRMGIEFQGTNHDGAIVEGNQFSEWRDRYHESFGLSIVNWGTNTIVRDNVMASGKIGQIDPAANNAPVGIEIMGRNSIVEGNEVYGFREGIHVGPSTTNSVFQNNLLDNQANMAFWHTGLGNSQNVVVQNNTIVTPRGGAAFLVTGGGHDGSRIVNNHITLTGNTQLIAGADRGVSVGTNTIVRR